MKKDRLLKLARLASGAAVVTMGPLAACTPSTVTTAPTGDGTNPPHTINAPASATPAEVATGGVDLAEAGVQPHPGINAPPLVTPDPSSTDPDAGPGGAHRFPPHGNAMPPTAPTHS